jgi:hypothetical protein
LIVKRPVFYANRGRSLAPAYKKTSVYASIDEDQADLRIRDAMTPSDLKIVTDGTTARFEFSDSIIFPVQ